MCQHSSWPSLLPSFSSSSQCPAIFYFITVRVASSCDFWSPVLLRDVTKYNKLFLDREWRLRTSKIAKIAKISKSYLRNWCGARLMLIVKMLTVICRNQRVFWRGCESKKYFEVRSIDFKACSSINMRNISMKLSIFFLITIVPCHAIFRTKNTQYFTQTLEHCSFLWFSSSSQNFSSFNTWIFLYNDSHENYLHFCEFRTWKYLAKFQLLFAQLLPTILLVLIF